MKTAQPEVLRLADGSSLIVKRSWWKRFLLHYDYKLQHLAKKQPA
jgi:hypothetical protein